MIREAEAYLDWHRQMGVDLDVGTEPQSWFALAEKAAQKAGEPIPAQPVQHAPQRRPAPARPTPKAAPPDEALMEARETASNAATLEVLHESLAKFDGCGLKATAKNLCFYRGAPQARLMIIGEAPGRDEDLSGTPFVGRAGKLLDKMLAAIDLDDTSVHITNIVYWRPPGNRNPTPQEVLVCRPFLDRQIELVAPDVIMILGRPAVNNLLANTESIMKQRGRWKSLTVAGRTIPAMPTLHPAYLLRTPLAKKMTWHDLQAVRDRLNEKEE
ncbi:MAG: uracil-DNA glycosylase [Hyphomicrobiaceae bacterium]